ncbi:MAG: GNAT family protein [Burkholderiales bacterium]|nr:GNAT family protein [Burkholderiales bacterium]
MTPPVVVRPASEADAANILVMRTRVFAETEYMLWEPTEFKDTVSDEAARIQRLNASANSGFLVATIGEELVGFCGIMGGGVNRLRHSATLVLGVLQSHWSKGVGHKLLSGAVVRSAEAGVTRLELTVHTTNIRAVNLYLRAGFQVEGLRRRSLRVREQYVDEYLMSRLHAA